MFDIELGPLVHASWISLHVMNLLLYPLAPINPLPHMKPCHFVFSSHTGQEDEAFILNAWSLFLLLYET